DPVAVANPAELTEYARSLKSLRVRHWFLLGVGGFFKSLPILARSPWESVVRPESPEPGRYSPRGTPSGVLAPSGSLALTSKPPVSFGPATTSPPTATARSAMPVSP